MSHNAIPSFEISAADLGARLELARSIGSSARIVDILDQRIGLRSPAA